MQCMLKSRKELCSTSPFMDISKENNTYMLSHNRFCQLWVPETRSQVILPLLKQSMLMYAGGLLKYEADPYAAAFVCYANMGDALCYRTFFILDRFHSLISKRDLY